ncbi:MAG: class I SAM-dependent methyltransferase [Planctomycetota bacterium]
MERVPEKECMDSPEEAREYAEMDHSEANAAFVECLHRRGCNKGELLDIGTGPCDIPMMLISSRSSAHITAIDLSEEMLKIARIRVAERGLSMWIRLMHVDAKELPFADDYFDGVFSNTILHHVDDPLRYFKEARRVLKSSGSLVIRDLMRPDTLVKAQALVEKHAGTATPLQRQMLLNSLKSSYTVDEVRRMLDEAGLGEASVEQSSDRHLTIWLEADGR